MGKGKIGLFRCISLWAFKKKKEKKIQVGTFHPAYKMKYQ